MLKGGCLCGKVRYESATAPFHPTLCHCETCRRSAGASPVAWFSVPRDGLVFTAEDPSLYQSSEKVTRGFCGHCGTTLSYENRDFPDEIDLTTCSLDDPEQMPPSDQTHQAEELSWLDSSHQLPAYPRSRSAGL